MVVAPIATPVTNPVEFTVAAAGFDDTQGLINAGVPEPVNCVVPGKQTFGFPVIAVGGI